MEPIKFDGFNVVYAEEQPEYLPMPVHKARDGTLTVCWKLSFMERVKVIFTGKIWQKIMTFNSPLQPQLMTCDSPVHNPGKRNK
jgi:hypothetical protein